MNAEEFRRWGYRVVDWAADYLEHADRHPVLPDIAPGEIKSKLPADPPEKPESMEVILRDFDAIVLPGVTHWNHPRFFAYFPANHSGPSILAELLSATLGVNGMVWQSCPAATELEEVVLDWLRKLIGLPETFRGVIQDTASTATLCALLCAREQSTDFAFNAKGSQACTESGPLRVYTSSQAHSSVEKGAKIAGFGVEHTVEVEVDDSLAMDCDDLARRITQDRSQGKRPCCIVATVGTTSSTAVDNLAGLSRIAKDHGLWLHVDAAMAGSAAILPEMRWMFEGVDQADSFVFNPHKWLFTNFDCCAFYCQRPQVLTRTFSILPEYLKTGQDDQATNYRDWGIALGRRFRALKLWFVLRYYGAQNLRQRLREHLALAKQFAAWVDESPAFERLAPVELQTVCFRYHPRPASGPRPDEAALERLNRRLMDAVNRSGRIFLTHTVLRGRFTLRLSIGQMRTERKHIEQAWEVLNQHLAALEPDRQA